MRGPPVTRGSTLTFKWEPYDQYDSDTSCSAYCRGKRVGSVCGEFVGEGWLALAFIEVLPAFRRKGIATLLLQRYLKKHGSANEIFLTATARKSSSISLLNLVLFLCKLRKKCKPKT